MGFSGAVAATEVGDFKSGLACVPETEHAWICHQTEDILLTGQGKCMYNRETLPCTWYGFSFKYRDNVPGTLLECEFTKSSPTDLGNPHGIVAEKATTGSYSIPLESSEGVLFNPQYSLYGVQQADPKQHTTTTHCRIAGKEVASFTFNVIVPVVAVD